MLDDHAPTDGVAGGGAVSPFEQQQQQQQQRQHRQQHCPPNARRGGPGPYAPQPSPRFQSRQQWADVRPWQKYDEADSAANTLGHHAQQPRPFRMQKTPPPGHSGSRRPVLELRSDVHIPPDLISPRSDSFFYGSSRPPRPCPSPTPTISHFQPVNRTRAESTPTQRPPRSAFPGLSSNPFIPESPESEDTSPVETRRSPLLSQQHEQLNRSEPDSNMGSPIESRQSTPTEPSVVVENFSRPRKTSVRSQQSDGALSRRMAAHRLHAEPPQHNQQPPPPPPTGTSQPPAMTSFGPTPNSHPPSRRPSASSSKTSSTFSSNPPHPNSEFFNPPPPKSDPSRQPTPAVIAPPPASHQRPPPALYNNNNSHAHLREAPAWLKTGDELRSSFRSQLTSSSGQGTVFTTHGTDRNSVITKASSVTEQSIINGYARRSWRATSVDDGPSLEDVMGMYERGFNDSDIESVRRSMRFTEDDDIPETDADVEMPGLGGSRPASSHSGASELRAKVLEAMNDSLPNPRAFPVPEPASSSTVRQSRNRRSLFPNSVPNSIGLGLASEHASRRERAESDTTDKRDSAKMLDGDDGPVLPEDADSHSPTTASPTSTAQVQPSSMADLPSVRTATPGAMPRLPQEPPEEPGSRDRYGFRKASANVTRQEYDAWDSNYSVYLARRRRKWIAFLKDNSLMTDRPNRFPPRSAKTKRFIRKGIPPDWRGPAWFYYAGGPAILSNNRGVYDQLVRRAGLEPSDPNTPPRTSELKPLIVDDIEKDLYRTFPDNVRFKPPPLPGQPQPPPEPEIITSLRRVLHAFALYNPRIGYCQSLNFLAGLLLLFVETEEQAFWLLNVITRVYLPGTHEMSLEGSKVDLGVLMIALKDSMPSVWKQIGGDELEAGKKHKGRRGQKFGHGGNSGSISDPNRLPAITLCMTAWFMSCFIGTLPIETVLRVWDVFFYEGSRTLFRIALTIFKLGEREIKAVKDPMEMFGVVQTFPRRMVDCNMLLETCYKRRNGIAHLSQEVVEEKRQERRDGIRRWKAEQEAAASQESSPQPTTKHRFGAAALGLDLATDLDEVRRKATLFGRRKDRAEQARATEVV
ncbi:hypothetical protein C7999DRAFT_17253 [Corynascus novoguineensis]|uniref:Rab-GAP TBC domain-containing protein n=1 Tax=Corynascus novoguineensis TaxID=1126955 RepID=A0AAN7HGG5_9PEZI|nr:hypothetical protein C7999DRAFT_17253 [Corynascus novoguineensis]